eukprot:4907016-Alexandrium_andersonii.AAC.1
MPRTFAHSGPVAQVQLRHATAGARFLELGLWAHAGKHHHRRTCGEHPRGCVAGYVCCGAAC